MGWPGWGAGHLVAVAGCARLGCFSEGAAEVGAGGEGLQGLGLRGAHVLSGCAMGA